jgi:hypothetical protein
MPSSEELYAGLIPPGVEIPPEIAGTGTGKFYDANEEKEKEFTAAAGSATAVPGTQVEADPDEPDDFDEDIVAKFDPRWLDEMEGLLFVGRVSHEFNLGGHKITIATPEAQDSLRAAMLIKQYQETAGALRALTLAALATCLIKVDGHVLPRGIMADGSDDMEARFVWVSKLHTSVVDGIYREYEELEIRVSEAIESLGKGGVPSGVLSVPG